MTEIDARDAGQLAGLSASRILELAKIGRFPEPVARRSNGTGRGGLRCYWDRTAVEKWVRDRASIRRLGNVPLMSAEEVAEHCAAVYAGLAVWDAAVRGRSP